MFSKTHGAAVQALLTELQQLSSPGQLRGWVADQRPRLSLSFLQWLAGLEAQAQGLEQQQLSILCGQLVAAREGLGESSHPITYSTAGHKRITQDSTCGIGTRAHGCCM